MLGEVMPWLVRWLRGWLLTGNLPVLWMWSRDFTMSGIERDSAQSQSRRSSFFGSLEYWSVAYANGKLLKEQSLIFKHNP